jgi:hypothetical protein
MNDRIEPFDILWSDLANVLGEGQRTRAIVVIKPAVAVKAAIYRDDVEPTPYKPWPENGTDIPVGTGNQYPHTLDLPS